MGFQNRLAGMGEQKWKVFKDRNIKHIWRSLSDGHGWIRQLWSSRTIDFIEKHGLEKYYHLYHAARFRFTGKPAIPTSLEYMATTHCNMACEECNTRIPFFSRKGHIQNPDFAQFKADIDKLLGSVNFIAGLILVGGEPLLNKDLAKMVEYACRQSKIKHVSIATNCTILPSQELISAMKHRKFAAHLSNYCTVEGIKNQYQEWKEIVIREGISARLPHDKINPDSMLFIKMPKLFPDRQEEKKVLETFSNCFGQYCNMLVDGVLVQCTIAVYIWQNMKRSQELCEEAVNIRELDQKELTRKLIEFYSRPYPSVCHYCHWSEKMQWVPMAQQFGKAWLRSKKKSQLQGE